MRQDDLVRIPTRLRAWWLRNRDSIPEKGKRFVSFSKAATPAPGPIQTPIQWISLDVFPGGEGVKRPRGYANHSPPSSVKVKNDGSFISIPPTRLHGVHRGTFTFYISGEMERVLKCIRDRFKMSRCGYVGGKEVLGKSWSTAWFKKMDSNS